MIPTKYCTPTPTNRPFNPAAAAAAALLQVSFRKLLDVFFDRVDPTTLNRQGNDRGTQYRSGIFTHDLQQQQEAQEKIAEVNKQLQEVRFETWAWGAGGGVSVCWWWWWGDQY
jgi:hypothetical protein